MTHLAHLRSLAKAACDGFKGSGSIEAKATRQLFKGRSSMGASSLALRLDGIRWANSMQGGGTIKQRYRELADAHGTNEAGSPGKNPDSDGKLLLFLMDKEAELPETNKIAADQRAVREREGQLTVRPSEPAPEAVAPAPIEEPKTAPTTEERMQEASKQLALEAMREAAAAKATPEGQALAEEHSKEVAGGLEAQLASFRASPRSSTNGKRSSKREPKNPLEITEPVRITFAGTDHQADLQPDGTVRLADGSTSKLADLEKRITGKSYAKPFENWTFQDENDEPQLIDRLRKTPRFTRYMAQRWEEKSEAQIRAKLQALSAQLALLNSILSERQAEANTDAALAETPEAEAERLALDRG